MLERIQLFLLSAPLGKTLRHGIAASSGALLLHGLDVQDSISLISSLALLIFAQTWSAICKEAPSEKWQDMARQLFTLMAGHGVSAISGALALRGFAGDANQLSELLQASAVLLFGGNLGLSAASRPDTESIAIKAIIKDAGGSLHVLLAGVMLLSAVSCAPLQRITGMSSTDLLTITYGATLNATDEYQRVRGQIKDAQARQRTAAKQPRNVLP